MNILLTGEIRVGKTTVCEKLIEFCYKHDLIPRGILTPAIYDLTGKKIGCDALNIETGERWLLAHIEHKLDGPQIGHYTFNREALQRAIEVLKTASKLPYNLLIIDEIGPLELEYNEGFAPIVDLLPFQGNGHVLLVVRQKYFTELSQKLNQMDFKTFNVTVETRDLIPRLIAKEICE
jgi:nucleoside-triphosphatase THEP1